MREDDEPPCARRPAAEIRKTTKRAFRQLDDRPRGGQRHDHHDEQRFGVVDRVVQIVCGCRPASRHRDGEHEWHAPEREHDFDLAMEMQDLGCHARARCEARRFLLLITPMLNAMSGLDESRREERMNNGEEEDDRRDRVEGIRLYP